MLGAQFLLALSLALLPTQDPPPDKWLLIVSTENSVLEVSNNSINIDKDERSVEFILRTTLQQPVPFGASSVKVMYDSVIVMCTQRTMVIMSQYGNDASGAKTFENLVAKVFRFTGNRASVSDNVISSTCQGFAAGEAERNKPATPLQPRVKPGTQV